jgi:LPXTG-motif cell wall-anchored protein
VNECVRRALPGLYLSAALLFTGAALLSGAAAAQAADSVGNSGVGNGNQVEAPVSVPVNVCGNAVGVLGNAEASCDGHGKDKGDKDKGGDKPDDHGKTSSPSAKPTPTANSTRRTDPSATASPTASPGGGGSPELPRTGASLGWLIGAAAMLVGAGAGLIALARHRVRRGLHAA